MAPPRREGERRWIVLTSHPTLRTPRRLVDAGRRLGIAVELREPPPRAAPDSAAGALLLARPGTFSFVPLLREHRRLVVAGADPLQPRRALLDAGDKLRTLARARSAGLAVPPTVVVRHPSQLRPALSLVAGPPWILKARRGSQGAQVVLAASVDDAVRAAHLFWGTGASFLLQPDLRALGDVERHLVVHDRVVASAIARPAPGEFRSNAHRGGRFCAIAPGSTPAAALALRALQAVGLPLAAVDTIGEREPLLLEVNASPGLEALERATGRDLATPLLETLRAARAAHA